MNPSSRLLPEYYLDKADRGALLSTLFNGDLRLAVAVCAVLALLALLLVALRARLLKLDAGATAAAVAIVALCMSSRAGIAFDTAAWFFAAALLLISDLGERYRWYLPVIVLVWSITVDSGTIGSAIVLLRAFNTRTIQHFSVAAACILASLFSASGLSLVFGGARSLYFDMLLTGADRQPLWSSPIVLSALGVFAIVTVAAVGGFARKERFGDVALFVTFFVAAVLDVRMAPFFAIAVAPPLFDRYGTMLRIPSYLGAGAAAAVLLVAVAVPPAAADAALFSQLTRDGRTHRVVCLKPSWCNPVLLMQAKGITALTVGIPSVSSLQDRQLQKRIGEDTAAITSDLRAAHADALVAFEQSAAPALLLAEGGWRVAARDGGGRILIVKERVR